MVSDREDPESDVRVNRKMELVRVQDEGSGQPDDRHLLSSGKGRRLCAGIRELIDEGKQDQLFWEEALYKQDRMIVPAWSSGGGGRGDQHLRAAAGAGRKGHDQPLLPFQCKRGEVHHAHPRGGDGPTDQPEARRRRSSGRSAARGCATTRCTSIRRTATRSRNIWRMSGSAIRRTRRI